MHRATLCTCQRRVSSVTLTRTEPESKLDTTRLNSPLEEETLPDTFPLDNFKELGSNWNCIDAAFVCQTSQRATISWCKFQKQYLRHAFPSRLDVFYRIQYPNIFGTCFYQLLVPRSLPTAREWPRAPPGQRSASSSRLVLHCECE
jgi:hypothetical protein